MAPNKHDIVEALAVVAVGGSADEKALMPVRKSVHTIVSGAIRGSDLGEVERRFQQRVYSTEQTGIILDKIVENVEKKGGLSIRGGHFIGKKDVDAARKKLLPGE